MRFRNAAAILITLIYGVACFGQTAPPVDDYKLLATLKTSTMQKELDEASAQGYRVLVGSTTGGLEMAVFLSKEATVEEPYRYKLLATTRTVTMQKELNEAADAGYRLIPSTIIAKDRLFGGAEIVLLMELPPRPNVRYEYLLLATSRTSTLQKEVREAKEAGFAIVGMVSRGENMVIMERVKDMPPRGQE